MGAIIHSHNAKRARRVTFVPALLSSRLPSLSFSHCLRQIVRQPCPRKTLGPPQRKSPSATRARGTRSTLCARFLFRKNWLFSVRRRRSVVSFFATLWALPDIKVLSGDRNPAISWKSLDTQVANLHPFCFPLSTVILAGLIPFPAF